MKNHLKILCVLIIICACKQHKQEHTKIVNEKNDTLKPKNILAKLATPKISKERLLGKIDYKNDSLFVLVESKYVSKPLYLNTVCFDSFKLMFNAAKNDGIDLKIISGARNFNYQKRIWERKWQTFSNLNPKERSQKILEYSAMPSTSRHHWGTDIDINSLSSSYFNSGKGAIEYNWLSKNANRFGFYQVYTSKESGRTGYNEEQWHWSYLPIASQYLDDYNAIITVNDIIGFNGAETAESLNIISDYVNGISNEAQYYNRD
ncbi:M15 family metallopeptidase [Ichthyenterobacterium sp. W332]|uniref:M15 family metallopeptidase n=1 Tax=Microcosmobacter mediterraneus TaxID=3075607 RepID=A0ABU2YNI0_9FLAO|nr:M15 family metallopeptidase [Ichthyenterobacterium sp. W332]MDT0558820.1 M15 family metallopeptidase [Ichthyenterobacterium sp. W332]